MVERRVYTVTGQKASEDEIDRMIETGEAENIFQKSHSGARARACEPPLCLAPVPGSWLVVWWWFRMGICKRIFKFL